jgi:hypothetical protein
MQTSTLLIIFILLTVSVSYGESQRTARESKSTGHVQMMMMMEAEEMAEEILMQNSPPDEETGQIPKENGEQDKEQKTNKENQNPIPRSKDGTS